MGGADPVQVQGNAGKNGVCYAEPRQDMSDVGTLADRGAWFRVRTLRVETTERGPAEPDSPTAEGETVTVGTAPGNDLQLSDPTVSRFHLELSAGAGGVLVVDRGSTNGTWIGSVRVDRAVVPPGTSLRIGRTALRALEGDGAVIELPTTEVLAGMVGSSTPMRRLYGRIEQLAKASTAVLIQGESGTGKELAARALHDLGPRARMPFVTFDCGALAPSLVTSELFGHEAGAFTGAQRRHIGAFERAHGGTLFLDEVGELPLSLQTNLLGVIERRRFRRLGGSQEIGIDVRVISATNRDLMGAVNAGLFRLDLFYRIAVVVLTLPALRERVDDLLLLIEHFARECGEDGPIGEIFPADVLEELRRHRWPGNIRELRNLVEATLATGETTRPTPLGGGGSSPPDPIGAVLDMDYKQARGAILCQFEARFLKHILERTGGNVARAAREAKMDRSHLIALLRRHEMRRGETDDIVQEGAPKI